MQTKTNARTDIHRTRLTIQSGWSEAERTRRRRIAARRQRALLRMLLPSPELCSARQAPAA